jgi:hypothetical protein
LGSNNSLESLFGDESPGGNVNEGLLDPVIEGDQSLTSIEMEPEQTSLEQQPCKNVFLTCSIDGAISLWDRRRDKVVAQLAPAPKNTPPWCMSVIPYLIMLMIDLLVYEWGFYLCRSTKFISR